MEEAYRKSAADVLQSLRVERARGLSDREVEKRLQTYGKNALPKQKKTRLILLLLDRFRDVLVIILVLAGVISVLLGHTGDAIIIAIAVSLDATLSFVQTWRTERTLAQMRKQIEDTTTVIRNGKLTTIPTKQLVPGDIIEFRAGEKMGADARLIHVRGLKTQEAPLTGESSDVAKETQPLTRAMAVADRRNMVFAGTTAVAGSGTAVVTATGTKTEFGKIAQLLREQRSPRTPLRQKLQQTGMYIGWVIIGSITILATLSILRGATVLETFRTSITLVVSAIPEDLTMILTIALTVGVRKILKQGGVVRKLSSGETLGSATVICTDKTGTLTEGKMQATGFHVLQGDELDAYAKPNNEFHKLAYVGLAISTDAHSVSTSDGQTTYIGSATERTGLAFVEQVGFSQENLLKQWRVRDTITFSTKWKFRACIADHPTQSTQTLFVVGAPDILLEKSSDALDSANRPITLDGEYRYELGRKIEALAGQGKRLVAVAIRRNMQQTNLTQKDVTGLTFLGVLAITDPVRKDVASSIAATLAAGVDVKLITGDHAATAVAIARQVGLTANQDTSITGNQMQELTDEELTPMLDRLVIFARVEPLDKQRIIRLLQKQGHIVAMTGDGINDAVALKGADIGVAVQSGSDVAREAADLVLLNNSFTTIVSAIKEGRVLRDNVRKVIAFLLATNAAEVAIFFVSVFMGIPLPLLPAQILWINLVTDGTSDIALSLEPAEDNVMKRNPEIPDAPLLGKRLVKTILFSGVIMTIITMAMFFYEYKMTDDLTYARTMAFTALAVTSLISVWSFRSLKQTILKRGFLQNPWVLASTSFSITLHLIAIYHPSAQRFFDTVPLSIGDWAVILSIAVLATVLMDTRKLIFPDNTNHINKATLKHPVRHAPQEG